MARSWQIRTPTDDERETISRLAHARTVPARTVERARVVLAALAGERVEAIAARMRLSVATVYLWLHRFHDDGIAGLDDRPRSGRPPTYAREQVATIIATALTAPQQLEQPFASWTLDRLVTYVHEQHGISMQRSRLNEVLLSEGLRWRQQERWFGERVDPDFAAKRGQ